METNETIKKIAVSVAERMKLEIFDVDFKQQKIKSVLKIVIDDPNGYVSVDQCERFSKEISPLLDAESDIENYTLEVSSPGLNRSMRKIEDFERFMGKLVKIKFADDSGKNTTIIGRITGCDVKDGTFSLDKEGIISNYEFSKLISANLVVEF